MAMEFDRMGADAIYHGSARRAERTTLVLAVLVFVLLMGTFLALSFIGR